MGPLLGTLGEENAIIGNDADGHAVEPGEACNQGLAIEFLELVELRAVNQAGNHLADIVGRANIRRHDTVQLGRVIGRLTRIGEVEIDLLDRVERADNPARRVQGVLVIGGVMVGDARDAGMDIGPAQILGGDHLARGGLHQRRTGQEDRALLADNHRLVGHGRHIGTARRAGTHDNRDLGNALGRHIGLIVEDAPEMVAIGKDLGLMRQVGAAAIDQIDARQTVLHGDFLRPQMLFHRHRVVGAALDGRIIADNHHLATGDTADPGNHAGPVDIALIHAIRGQGADLEKGRTRVEQAFDAVSGQELAARQVFFAGPLGSADRRSRRADLQVSHKAVHRRRILLEAGGLGIERGNNLGHGGPESCNRAG